MNVNLSFRPLVAAAISALGLVGAFGALAQEGNGTAEVVVTPPNPDAAETPAPAPEAAAEPATEPAQAEAANAAAAAARPAEGEGTVAINLNNVNIDNVVKFLSETTGKAVLKHKDVNVQITVFSPAKVTPEKAFALVSEALMLEKIAVVQDKDTIKLVPADQLSEIVVDITSAEGDEVTGGVIKTLIPVRFADIAEIEKVVKPLVSKTGTLIAHPPSKKIIITDSASRVMAIKDIVAQLDVLDADERQVQVFELKHSNPEELAPIVKSVLTVLAARMATGQPQPGQPGQPPQPQPQQPGQQPPGGAGGVLDVVAYKSANWLVVVAPKEILTAADSLIKEFDREKPPMLSLHTIPIRFADAGDVASSLSNLFQKRPDKRVEDTVEITADERSSSLIILSSEENFTTIRDLVAELDTEESVQMTTHSFELKFADANDIADQLNDLYSGEDDSYPSWYWGGYRSRQSEKTRFVAETRTNSIIAITKPTEVAKVQELILKLDVPLDAEQVSPRIFRIKYVDAQEVTEVLNEVFGAEESSSSGGYYDYFYGSRSSEDKQTVGRLHGKVRFVTETSTNSIIVTTNNTENYKIIGKFIEELDSVTPDSANTMVVKLQYATAAELADQLNALFAAEGARIPPQQQQQQQQQEQEQQEQERGSSYSWLFGTQQKKDDKRAISNLIGQVRMVPDVRTNSLTIITAVQNHQILRDLINELDISAPKVLVRVRLIEVTTTKTSRIGTRFSSDPTVFETDDMDNGFRSAFGLGWEEVYHNGTISASANLDIGVLIQFLRRNANVRILSEPTMVMNNNETSDLFAGQRIPFITNSQSTPEGTLNQSFEYRDAGVTMKITPTINELDKVEMKVELESSQIRPGEVLFGGFVIDTREFNTQLAVQSGDTIVIGGILRESDAEATRGVPILQHIPGVNLAFRKRDTKRESTELIAFITPVVLRDAAKDTEVTMDAADRVGHVMDWQPFSGSLDKILDRPTGWRKWLNVPKRKD